MGTVDQGFVPAPEGRVYARLAGVERYGAWWPGHPEGLAVESERPGAGLVLRLRDGVLEWYLEPFKDGTIVNAILDLGDAGRRRVMRVRSSLRRGMVSLRALEEQP
jgi:hypothetical protein